MKKPQLHPYTRLYLLISGTIGVAICFDWRYLITFLFLLLPIMAINGSLKVFSNFVLVAIVPMTLMFVVFHWIQGLKSHTTLNHDLLTVLKLILYSSLLQIAFVIPLQFLHTTFKTWGIRNDILLTLVGSYFVWIDIVKRSERILLARLSQGYIKRRTFWSKMKQLPFILVPLIISIMRTASDRSDSWQQKNIVERFNSAQFNVIPVNNGYNALVILIVSTWILTIIFRLN